jgi:2,4-diketo-3-deoxy-L-fuconate hydrolase
MKLVRYESDGKVEPGLIDARGRIRSLSREIGDIDAALVGSTLFARLKDLDPAELPEVAGTPPIAACLAAVGNFVCIGLNYLDHAEESGARPPREPIIFGKSTNALAGPDDDIELPRGSDKTDWEVELAVVIGRTAKYVEESDALAHVAGYCTFNDVSERAFQLERGGQWIKGKSHDTFASLGPWLVSADEVPDPQALGLWTELNGARMQDGNTANMIFSVAHIIAYASAFMRLEPGDVIATGTPAGVGMGQKPPRYLAAGDVVRVGVQGLGAQTRKVVAPR